MKKFIIPLALVLAFSSGSVAQQIDISDASIIVSPTINSPVRETLVKILKEEVGIRTSLAWQQAETWGQDNSTIIAIALSGDRKLYSKPVPQRSQEDHPE